ncbi:hypothetical protein LCGC14_0723270 [marine sediment metagenome]|uniref:Uncharacterized protein n=1 Tax=marine sediment metagenome TaxID=412755 RepID=A0A0F9SX52_9ZZZZ
MSEAFGKPCAVSWCISARDDDRYPATEYCTVHRVHPEYVPRRDKPDARKREQAVIARSKANDTTGGH